MAFRPPAAYGLLPAAVRDATVAAAQLPLTRPRRPSAAESGGGGDLWCVVGRVVRADGAAWLGGREEWGRTECMGGVAALVCHVRPSKVVTCSNTVLTLF